jgi:hypothetical protein
MQRQTQHGKEKKKIVPIGRRCHLNQRTQRLSNKENGSLNTNVDGDGVMTSGRELLRIKSGISDAETTSKLRYIND